MKDVIEVSNQYYVRARSSFADDRTYVLLNGDTFAAFDRLGDCLSIGTGQFGVFCRESRHLSRLVLRLEDVRPSLLSSNIREDNVVMRVDLSNPDQKLADGQSVPAGVIHASRSNTARPWDAG